MAKRRLVLVGAGHMGGALARGWLNRRTGAKPVIVDPKPSEAVTGWAASGKITLNPQPQPAGTLVLAVKPQLFGEIAQEVSRWVGDDTLIVSIMAGWRIEQVAGRLGTSRVVRVMPNTPGAVGQGVCLMAPGPASTRDDVERARQLLQPLGWVEGPMSEEELSLATGLSGSGPAYLFLLAESLAAAGEAEGLDADRAMRLARRTVIGAAALMAESDTDPSELRRAVTSPGGVTQAALDVLMGDDGMPLLFRKALREAVQRDRQLARSAEDTE